MWICNGITSSYPGRLGEHDALIHPTPDMEFTRGNNTVADEQLQDDHSPRDRGDAYRLATDDVCPFTNPGRRRAFAALHHAGARESDMVCQDDPTRASEATRIVRRRMTYAHARTPTRTTRSLHRAGRRPPAGAWPPDGGGPLPARACGSLRTDTRRPNPCTEIEISRAAQRVR